MRTNYDEMFEFDKRFNSILLDDVDFMRLRTNIRVYIPTLMSGIKKGKPKEELMSSNLKSVFVSEVKPKMSSGNLKCQNYMTVKNLNKSHITNRMQSFYDPRYKKIVAKAGTKLLTYFKNNKLSQLYAEVSLENCNVNTLEKAQDL